jgi:hypothetical protein
LIPGKRKDPSLVQTVQRRSDPQTASFAIGAGRFSQKESDGVAVKMPWINTSNSSIAYSFKRVTFEQRDSFAFQLTTFDFTQEIIACLRLYVLQYKIGD